MDDAPQQQAVDHSPTAALEKEAEEFLSHMAQTVRVSDHFCNDMQAAVNELSQYDMRRYLYVTQTCDHIKDCMEMAKQQSQTFINSEKDHTDRTRNRIKKMSEQLRLFRNHRNRITELYLRGTMSKNPEPRQLEWNLEKHMSLLRDDVQRLLDMANGKSQDGDNQAAGDASGPSQPESHQD